MLQIYNTLTKQKEVFKPIKAGEVNLYVCGMTVYDYCHIGNGRSVFIVFDIVKRYLRYRGYTVKHVCNITDIDDKIIHRANENNEDYFTLTERFIKAMHEDRAALGVSPPDIEPRATQYIPQIITLVQTLLDNNHAYIATNGDVYFRVNSFANYGKLAHQDLEKLRAGARVDVIDAKHDALDFVLWKMAKPNEPSWDSPWGKGRPGWHIECSAMAMGELGNHFDIHGGGLDLQFPHHQNEVAQSEAATAEKFVNIWMHVGYVQMDKEKMSKSLGNFFTIRDVLAKYAPEIVRYFMAASHYRSPVNYSTENLNSAAAALERLYISLRDLPRVKPSVNGKFEQEFITAMDDDFNTPEALAVLFEMAREINRLKEENNIEAAAQLGADLKHLASILGILQQDAALFLQSGIDSNDAKKIEALIVARDQARHAKNWSEADRIRKELLQMNVVLEDSVQGTLWRKNA